MSSAAVPLFLRQRALTLTGVSTVTSPSGHKVAKVCSDRIAYLKATNDFHLPELIDELKGMLELAQGITVSRPANKKATQTAAVDGTGRDTAVSTSTQPRLLKDVVKIVQSKNENSFCKEFIDFLNSGDWSHLAPNGVSMTKELFETTHDYIFVNISKIAGRSVSGTFFSNPNKECNALLLPGITVDVGQAVILRRGGMITDALNLGENFAELGKIFNSIAARSK